MLLPIGVANRRLGGAGFRGRGASVALVSVLTGRALGEGGMANPSFGALEPLLLRLPPGTGGRSNGAGAGEDILYEAYQCSWCDCETPRW